MANKIQVTDTLVFLRDDREQGQIKSETQTEVLDFIRKVVTVPASNPETSYKPSELSTFEFLWVKPNGSNILLRTAGGGSQYDIPDGGLFVLMAPAAGYTDIRIEGTADPAVVDIVIGGSV